MLNGSPQGKIPQNGVCVIGKSTFGCNQLPLKSLNRFFWILEKVNDVGWAMVSWTIASRI